MNRMKIKIPNNKESIDFNEYDANEADEIEIYIPLSIKGMSMSIVGNVFDKVVVVFYEGTISDWKSIKKGLLKNYTVYDDWYGYYYHNAPIEESHYVEYSNWIFSKKVTIICKDGTIEDNPDENQKNPFKTNRSSYWK